MCSPVVSSDAYSRTRQHEHPCAIRELVHERVPRGHPVASDVVEDESDRRGRRRLECSCQPIDRHDCVLGAQVADAVPADPVTCGVDGEPCQRGLSGSGRSGDQHPPCRIEASDQLADALGPIDHQARGHVPGRRGHAEQVPLIVIGLGEVDGFAPSRAQGRFQRADVEQLDRLLDDAHAVGQQETGWRATGLGVQVLAGADGEGESLYGQSSRGARLSPCVGERDFGGVQRLADRDQMKTREEGFHLVRIHPATETGAERRGRLGYLGRHPIQSGHGYSVLDYEYEYEPFGGRV